MFDERMFETIAERTNDYARNQIANITQGRDPFEQMDSSSNKKHNSLYNWKDLAAADIMLFVGRIIIMSLVQKAAVH